MINTFRPCCRFPLDELGQYPTTDDVIQQGSKAFNNPFMIQLRQDMTNGTPRPECQKCYLEEKSGIVSMRQKGNKAFESKQKDLNFENLEFLEISLDNLCNLECRMCESTFSTKLLSRDKILYTKGFEEYKPINLSYKTLSVMDSLDLNDLKFVKMLGGEPLISPTLPKFLDKIPHPENVDLYIVTNATHIPEKQILERFYKFKSVKFTFSLDGIFKFNDYQRVGSNFKKTFANAKKLGSLFPQTHSIHSVYSVINLLGFEESTNWFSNETDFEKSVDLVSNNVLSAYHSPEWYKEAILSSISQTNPYRDYIQNLFQQYHRYDESKWKKLLEFVKITDSYYETNIIDINPLLAKEVYNLNC